MAYVTNADVELRLGPTAYVQLSDDAGSGAANEAVVDEARVAAEGEVDGYLARRFQTPIDLAIYPELAGLLAAVTLDVVEYRLHRRRLPVPDDIVARYRNALAWLAKVAVGEVALPSASLVASSRR
jgi:phage gp36-like protein